MVCRQTRTRPSRHWTMLFVALSSLWRAPGRLVGCSAGAGLSLQDANFLLRRRGGSWMERSGAMCVDAGPWPCVEAGCPSAWVGCESLAVACMAPLEDIWQRLPTTTLARRRVSDVCPFSCGTCEAHCELLSRETLTAPEHDILEVQRLRFALPIAASELPGPSVQVKVRAPDAPAQKMRVRACKLLWLSFKLTHNAISLA